MSPPRAVPPAVLFDLDGTLLHLPVDIEPARREIAALLAAAGWRGPAAPLLGVIDRAAAALEGDAAARLRQGARAILDRAELRAAPRARARPGAPALLAELSRRRAPLGLVTNQGRACVAPALAAAGLEAAAGFGVIVTRDDVAQAKPAPDGVVRAVRALLPGGGSAAFVGDSRSDVTAARAAHGLLGAAYAMKVVAVLGGRGSAADLAGAGADQVAAGLDQVAALL